MITDRRKVRRVVAVDGQEAQRIFDIAAGDRKQWDLQSWLELLAELDRCDDTVADWLAVRQ